MSSRSGKKAVVRATGGGDAEGNEREALGAVESGVSLEEDKELYDGDMVKGARVLFSMRR